MFQTDLAAIAAHAVISVVGGAAGTAASTFVQEKLRAPTAVAPRWTA